jgi:phosphohistidine phosphatase
MKTLLVLRHAKSDWGDERLRDYDRPLNARGYRAAPRMGRLIVDERIVPDVIATSTATRARDTADLVAEAAGYAGDVRGHDTLYDAAPSAYIQVLRGLSDEVATAMVVGHNPGVERLVAGLTGTDVHMTTANLARIALDVDAWEAVAMSGAGELVTLWRPKDLS